LDVVVWLKAVAFVSVADEDAAGFWWNAGSISRRRTSGT
jgi:hypothetical protein